jgi:hypothetical protein
MQSTIDQKIQHFLPEDSEDGDEARHKQVRHQALAPLQTTNDVEFTRQVQATLEKFDSRKAPEDALSSEILLRIFRSFPTVFTQIYQCLRRGHFPKQWKRSAIVPIVKPGKEGLNEAGKYNLLA